MRRPTGLAPPKNFATNGWLTITTGVACSAKSAAVNKRPACACAPNVSKNQPRFDDRRRAWHARALARQGLDGRHARGRALARQPRRRARRGHRRDRGNGRRNLGARGCSDHDLAVSTS